MQRIVGTALPLTSLTPRTSPGSAVGSLAYAGSLSQGINSNPYVSLWYAGEGDIRYYRSPGMVRCKNGDLLAVATAQSGTLDGLGAYIMCKRSTDGGVTWSANITAYTEGTTATRGVNSPQIVLYDDGTTYGKLIVWMYRCTHSSGSITGIPEIYQVTSTDNGATWSAGADVMATATLSASTKFAGSITSLANNGSGLIRVTTSAAHNLTSGKSYKITISGSHASANGTWTATYVSGTTFDLVGSTYSATGTGSWACKPAWFGTSSGNGIVTAAGVILMPFYWRWATDGSSTDPMSGVMRSEDGGTTWTMSTVADENSTYNIRAIEPQIVETAAGTIYMTCRDKGNGGYQLAATSSDSGATWGNWSQNTSIVDSGTKAGLCKVSQTKLVLSHTSDPSNRVNLCLNSSSDSGTNWTADARVYPGGSGYSCLCHLGNEKIGVLWEKCDNSISVAANTSYIGEIAFAITSFTKVKTPPVTQIDYQFGDWANALTYPALGGHQIKDSGPLRINAGANGTITSNGSGAVISAGSSNYIEVVPASRSYISSQTFTIEKSFSTTEAGNVNLLGQDNSGANSVYIKLNAGTVTFAIVDNAGSTKSATVTATYSDGASHTVRAEYDASTGKMRVAVDGVYGSDTSSGVLTFKTAALIKIGNNAGTAGSINASVALTVSRVRITIGSIPADTIYGQTVTRSPWAAASFPTNFPSNDVIPRNGFKLLVDPAISSSHWYADSFLSRPVGSWVSGRPFRSMIDHGANNLRIVDWAAGATGFEPDEHGNYYSDAVVGPYISSNTATSQVFWKALLTSSAASEANSFDWLLSTKTGTIAFFVKPQNCTSFMIVLDTSSNDGVNDGLRVSLAQNTSNSFPNLYLKCGGAAQYSQNSNVSGLAVTTADWWFVAIVLNGAGASKVDFWIAPVSTTTTLVAGTNKGTPSATMGNTAPGTTATSLGVLSRSSTSGSGRYQGLITGLAVHSDAWTLPQLQAWFDWKKVNLGT